MVVRKEMQAFFSSIILFLKLDHEDIHDIKDAMKSISVHIRLNDDFNAGWKRLTCGVK